MDAKREELEDTDAEEESEDELPEQVGMNAKKARECLKKYLSGLYTYIKRALEDKLPDGKDWGSTTAWFLFSYPTTWSDVPQRRFREIVMASSFAQEANHWVNALALDEAQAAMASVSSEQERMRAGHSILIVDIGGGTTDVNTFIVKKDDGKKVQLQPAKNPTGRKHGSVYIDTRATEVMYPAIEESVARHQNPAFRELSPEEKKKFVESSMVKVLFGEQYMDAKHDFNLQEASKKHEMKIPIHANNSPNAAYVTADFEINSILKNNFDKQCRKIWNQIERHLDYEPKASEVNCLVLTGGLSNNKYVQSFFKEKVQESSRTFGDVVTAEKSELAVSKGLVFDALESINRGGLFRYETRYFYGIAAYDSNKKVEVTKFLDKGKVVDIKDFSRKEDVKFELVDGNIADLKLVSWYQGDGKDERENQRRIKWMWSSKTKTARVKLSCERRTLTVTITDGNGTEHPLVFNEEWHVGTAVRPRPKSKRKRLKQYADAAEKLSWLAGLLIFFIPFGDEDEATEAQGGEEATDQYVEVTDQYAEDEESGDLDY
ncbi:hypothetical protein KHU50_002705 [Colletotrichum sp. SAR 10_65]|nr:hypothetical protein KHU50_002705 [Colletotrichum sp. SAR 10_65]